MSVLGVAWDENRLYFSCRTGGKTFRLDEISNIEVSTEINTVCNDVPIQGRIEQLFDAFFFVSPEFIRPELKYCVATYFDGVIDRINNDRGAQVVLMQPIDKVVFVGPPHVKGEKLDDFVKFLSGIEANVQVIAHHISYAAYINGGTLGRVGKQVYLLVEWGEDLTISEAFAYETLQHYTPIGHRFRVDAVGPLAWRGACVDFLRYRFGLFSDRKEGALLVVDDKNIGDLADEVIRAQLNGESELTTEVFGVDPKTDEECKLPIHLTERELSSVVTPFCNIGVNLANQAVATLNGKERPVVLYGEAVRSKSVAEAMLKTFVDAGYKVADKPLDAALFGVHDCVERPPMLDFDCGVILKSADAKLSFGTLVLVQPAAVGEMRESGPFDVNLSQGDPLEVAFYIRRIDIDSKKLSYEVMKSHVFAPHVGVEGRASINVAMRVLEPQHGQPISVTIDLIDNLSGKTIKFKHLPIEGGEPMPKPPYRNPDELHGEKWAVRLEAIREVPDGVRAPVSIAAWRRALEGNVNRAKASKKAYLRQIFKVFDNDMSDMSIYLSFRYAKPDEFQDHARRLLFTGMHEMAKSIGRQRCMQWRSQYNSEPPLDVQCAVDFVNALSPDLAEAGSGELETSRAKEIIEIYRLACLPTQELNVNWSEQLG